LNLLLLHHQHDLLNLVFLLLSLLRQHHQHRSVLDLYLVEIENLDYLEMVKLVEYFLNHRFRYSVNRHPLSRHLLHSLVNLMDLVGLRLYHHLMMLLLKM
tara:strand:+ start:163 stop:462 length:300 start_codon:yes stop_codon:yes gene_type:complete